MPSTERDHSDERSERSTFSKLPMWDSSDPDRCPPPLPMNPQASPATVRPGAAASIVQAAMMFTEKPRENSISSQYTTNPLPDRAPERSPERSLIKGAAHRRLQSVRDIRNVLDGRTTPERSPERSATPSFPPPHSPETPSRSETPSRRPSSRPNKMFGENTPPSATMLALQTMTVRDFPDPPLANITNGSTKAPQSVDQILSQMASLTSIATNLQKEMAHLTRRSKDNASDLNSLKEATHARDEDIRKSLKDLVHTISKNQTPETQATGSAPNVGARSFNEYAGLSTPPPIRAFTVPRISSPGAIFEEGISSRIGSPNPYSVEGAASVAMLEKIIREMVTKDGQERLLVQLNELFEKSSLENGTTAKKVADLVEFIKEGPPSRALVFNQSNASQSMDPQPSVYSINPTSSALTIGSRDLRPSSAIPVDSDHCSFSNGSEFVNDEVIGLLKKIKDSVFHSGAVVNEVKAQQRDLRHEVIGIGRNLAQKIDDARKPASNAKAIEDGTGKQDIARIVTEGLSDLKAHLDSVMREKRRQSTSSNISRATVDSREVYDVVKHAIATRGIDVEQSGDVVVASNLDKEAIVEAIKEAYEAYQPNINVQQFGLEREEILECLREGLEGHSHSNEEAGLNRAEIMETIHEAMANFTPPQPINDVHEVREEVIAAVRECLDELRPSLAVQPLQPRPRDMDAMPEMIVDAVRTGLRSDGPLASQTLEISADDLFDAVTRALSESTNPLERFGDEIRTHLANIIVDLHEQFKQYSAAHGRDTEQVLDAMRDGQELLRADVEQYVDRAQDVTGKDEIIEEIRQGVSHVIRELEESIAIGPQGDARFDMIMMREEFEKLNSAVSRLADSDQHRNILDALHVGFEEMKATPGSRSITNVSEENIFGEAVRGELEQVRDTVIMRSEGHKDEILDSVKIGFEILESKLGAGSYEEVRSELEHLRSTLAGTMGRSGDSADSRELMEDIQLSLSDLKSRLLGSDDSSNILLSTIHSEFQTLRASLNSGTVSKSLEEDEDVVVMDSLRDTLEAIREASGAGSNEMAAEALQKVSIELAKVASAVNSNRDNAKADYEELLQTVRCGLDDLRADVFKKLDNPEGQIKAYGEIIDTINESNETLKTDLAESISKPIDLTICYDIMQYLKDEIADLKANISVLKEGQSSFGHNRSLTSASNEIILADGDMTATSRAVAPEPVGRGDIQQLEVMLASLQVKVEALSNTITDMPSHATSVVGGTTRQDISPLENLIKDMQATLDLIASREDGEGAAKKEDTDAIETLLRNIKSNMEETSTQIVPAGHANDQFAELFEKLENAIGGFSEDLKEDVAKKEDVDVIQQLLLDLKPMMDDIKTAHSSGLEEQSKTLNISIDALRLIALEVKEKVLEMHQNGSTGVAAKSDLDQITGLIHDFRDSHDKLKESYESDIGITARAFDDRKQEASDIIDAVQSLRDMLEGVQVDISSKLTSTGDDVMMLVSNINTIEETIKANFGINEVLGEIREKMERDFDRIAGTLEALKSEQDTQTASIDAKHAQVQLAVVNDVTAKVAEHCDALAAKFEEARADTLAATVDQREILESNKSTAADLQLSVDTLGMTITGLKEDCERLTGKVSEGSEVVFTRVDNGFAALQDLETRASATEEHRQTRQDVDKVLTAVDALQTDVTDFHPRFMVTLEEIREIVNQQFEHARKAKEEFAERERARDESSRSITDEIRSSFSTLPALLPPPVPAIEASEKFDDAAIHSKLDQLLIEFASAKESTVQMTRLDKIHEQVSSTAAELTAFVASQTRLITEGHESKEKELQESAILLERRRVEQEHLQSDIISLTAEKNEILAIVGGLRTERDSLVNEKAKVAAEVSALQTALHIRREELHAMDAKADALERRILEGIMDQSRAMLFSRGTKDPAANIRAPRVASNVSHSTVGSMAHNHPAANGITMAMKTRSAAAARRYQQQTTDANTGRRIMSLNQITGNTPTGAQAYRQLPTVPGSANNLTVPSSIMKRSQSVRSPAVRKVSWNTRNVQKHEKRRASHALDNTSFLEGEDKENIGQLQDIRDEEEDESIYEEHSFVDDGASTGTVTVHDVDGESVSDGSRRDSARSLGTESYTTGSYVTGTDGSRRTSNVSESNASRRTSEITGSVGQDGSDVADEAEDEYSVRDFAHEESESGTFSEVGELEDEGDTLGSMMDKKLVLFGHDVDSGIGSEAPTAGLERDHHGENADYFRRAAEDECQ